MTSNMQGTPPAQLDSPAELSDLETTMPEPTTPEPSSATSSLLHDTPFHQRLSSTLPQTSTNAYQETAFVEAATEMKGKFWGPVPVDRFFEEFLDVEIPTMPKVNKRKLAAIAKKPEKEMYKPLIEALKPFCEGITLIDTSAHVDPDSGVLFDYCIKPDIGIYDDDNLPSADKRTQARLMTGFGELKNEARDEPFTLGQPLYSFDTEVPFESDTMCGRDTRGQITLYANAIQATQFRTHSFSFFINRTNCRLIHWSRSCAIVTEEFDYTKSPWLAEFFWRLSHASKAARGFDTTFTSTANKTEEKKARAALHLKNTDALYKVVVNDDVTGKDTFYIVSKPFTNNHIFPVGRGTRCFKAYDCQTRAVVLLKDTWRVDKYEKEGSVYRELHKAGVRNIATFIAAGDVGHVCGETEIFSDVPEVKRPRVHFHYRLVIGTIGTSLTKFSSTWQLVSATTSALIAHWDAVTKAKILHRDISSGNILIVGDAGILIDWELCRRIGTETARSYEKTGTYQFISARLLVNSTQERVHNVGDDLESFVHVLTWAAIKYARNDLTPVNRTRHLRKFDSIFGGDDKAEFIGMGMTAIVRIGLNRKPFSAVLKAIYSGFGHRYGSTEQLKLEDEDEAAAEAELKKLETHDWLYNILRNALEDSEWKAATDGRVDQEVLEDDKYLTNRQKSRKKSMIPEYEEELNSNAKRSRRG